MQEISLDRSILQAAVAESASTPASALVSTEKGVDNAVTTAVQSTSKAGHKARTPLVINVNDEVKVVPMLHPGQRQHKAVRLKVN